MKTHFIPMAFTAALLTGCGGATDEDMALDSNQNALKTWYWQLTGQLKTDKPVQIYDIDLFETEQSTISELHQRGIKVICYFSAGSWEPNRPDSNDYPQEAIGNTVEGWPDEKWVDIRNMEVRNIVEKRIIYAKLKTCDGVEPDNVDGYTHSTGFHLSYENQLNFNRFLAQKAFENGLEIGLKNDMVQIPDLVDDFDFAINEQCHAFNECNAYFPFIQKGKPVLNAEYDAIYRTNQEARQQLCEQARSEGISTLITNQALDGSEAYSCALNAPL